MTTSGTSNFSFSNADVIFEAFDRLRVRPSAIDRHHMMSARNSLALELNSWNTRGGPNLWKVSPAPVLINLVAGQLVYVLPANVVTLLELYYTQVNGNGQGYNSDRIMVPLTRTQYAMLPNKAQPGTPTQYWYEKLATPQVTIYQPAVQGAPAYVMNYFALLQIQDANLGGGETPDIVMSRGLDTLCSGLAFRLAPKFLDMSLWDRLYPALEKQRNDDWTQFTANDQEPGQVLIQPNVGVYGIMRR